MALKNTIDKLEDVDEKYRTFYTEKDGKFHLDQALREDDKLDEFRNSNRDQHNKITELTQSMATQQTKIDELTTSLSGKDKAGDEAKKSSEERIAALEVANVTAKAETAAATETARRATLSDTLGKIGAAKGVKPSALQTFAGVHVAAFGFDENGAAFVLGKEGRPKLSDANAGERMTAEEYVVDTLQKEDFWLLPSKGDGAPGDGGGGGNVRTITKSEAEANWSTYEKDISAGKVVVVSG